MGNRIEAIATALWNRGWFRTSRIVFRLGGNAAKRANARRWDAAGLPF
jgi:hypothetical protein